eukprot:3738921-Pleurochrysis_carterae.AAC.1
MHAHAHTREPASPFSHRSLLLVLPLFTYARTLLGPCQGSGRCWALVKALPSKFWRECALRVYASKFGRTVHALEQKRGPLEVEWGVLLPGCHDLGLAISLCLAHSVQCPF